MSRYLLDTNVLIYCVDAAEPVKRARALEVTARLVARGTAVVPIQALAEFARVSLARLRPPVPSGEVYAEIERLERIFPLTPLTPAVVLEAVRGVRDHGFAYYDAQIWAAARLNQVPVILSEDFAAGTSVEGVAFVDPFAPTFDPAAM